MFWRLCRYFLPCDSWITTQDDVLFSKIPKKGDVESYTYKTYGQVASEAKKFAYFLEKEGLVPGKDVFGIFSANNYQYDVAIVGGYYRNLANSSLYDTLGPQVKHIF